MTVFAHPLTAADPDGSLVARSDSHPSLGVVVVAVAVVAFLFLLLAGAIGGRPSVVVVEQPVRFAGTFLGVVVIVIAVGILFFALLGPGSGSA